MQSLDVFLSRLIPRVPGCPDVLAKQALVDSAIEFCEETQITQATVAPMNVVANQAAYTLVLPAQQAISCTLKAWYNDVQLYPISATNIDSILAYVSSAGSATVETGIPNSFYELSPGVIAVYPVPLASVATSLSARVATKPTRAADSLEDILYNDWVDGICAGAAQRICSIPSMPFTSAMQAQAEKLQFWSAVSSASALSRRGRLRVSQSVRPRSFA